MSNLIISNSRHRLYKSLKKLDGFIDYETFEQADLGNPSFVIDCTALSSSDKMNIYEKFSCPIFSDLSLNDGNKLFNEVDHLAGAFSAVYPTITNACEVSYKKYSDGNLLNFLKKINLKAVEVYEPGIGFIFARTLSQIINEAWFALEDNLAKPEAIDTAMLYGVNYPRGPLDWANEAGLINTVTLLEELHHSTGEDRYRVCPKLKKAIS